MENMALKIVNLIEGMSYEAQKKVLDYADTQRLLYPAQQEEDEERELANA